MEMLLKKLNKTEPVIEYTAPTPATAKDSGVIDFMDEKQRFEAAVTTIRYESLDEEKYIHLN